MCRPASRRRCIHRRARMSIDRDVASRISLVSFFLVDGQHCPGPRPPSPLAGPGASPRRHPPNSSSAPRRACWAALHVPAVLLPDGGRRGQMSGGRPPDRPFSSPSLVASGPGGRTRRRPTAALPAGSLGFGGKVRPVARATLSAWPPVVASPNESGLSIVALRVVASLPRALLRTERHGQVGMMHT